jgi:hypothetical protein
MAFAISAESSRLKSHLLLCGLSRLQANQILSLITRWQSHSGCEWTVQRLKDLKIWYIQQLAGNLDYSPDWFAKKGTIPSGPFSHLFRINKGKRIVKVISALMVYTGFKSKKMTQLQAKKSVHAISDPAPWMIMRTSHDPMDKYPDIDRALNYIKAEPLEYNFSFSGFNTTNPEGMFGQSWVESFNNSLADLPTYRFLRDKFGLDTPIPISANAFSRYEDVIGSIAVIQERGFKARVVAMPNAGIQVCLTPLSKGLDRILKTLPEDCTHNQKEGAEFAKMLLLNGITVHAVDLSSATDRFPLDIQLYVLEKLGYTYESEYIAKTLQWGQWRISNPAMIKELGDDLIQYIVGQPQGMMGSFPLFALTHNVVLQTLCVELRIPRDPLNGFPFRVLGDDVVIGDDRLHEEYRALMQRLHVPISESKSLTSDKVTEFAGFVITPDRIFRPAKVPNSSMSNGFLNYLAVMGRAGLKELPSSVRAFARALMQLPENEGGLGLNPDGKPLFVRRYEFEEAIQKYIRIPETTSVIPQLVKTAMVAGATRDTCRWLNDQFNQLNKFLRRDLGNLQNISTDISGFYFQLSDELYQPIGVALTRNPFDGYSDRDSNQKNSINSIDRLKARYDHEQFRMKSSVNRSPTM